MKKLLSILAAVGLSATASTAVVACGSSSKDDTPSVNADAKWADGKVTLTATGVELPDGTTDAKALFDLKKGDTAVTITSATFTADGGAKTAFADEDGGKDTPAAKNVKGKLVVVFAEAQPEATTKFNYTLTGKDAAKAIKISFSVEVKGSKPDAPTDNSKVTIKSGAAVDANTITLTTDPLVVAAKNSDFTFTGGVTVKAVKGDAKSSTVTITTNESLTSDMKVTVTGYATSKAVTVDMSKAPAPKPVGPTDNSKVTIKSGAAVDANTITLTTDPLVVAAKNSDFTFTGGVTVKAVKGDAKSSTVTITTNESLTSDMKVTVTGYATSKAVTVNMSKAPAPKPKDNSALSLKDATLGDDLQSVTINVSDNLVEAVKAGDITISGAATAGINAAVTDVKADAGQKVITFKLAAAAVKGTDTTITVTIKGFKAGTVTITVPEA